MNSETTHPPILDIIKVQAATVRNDDGTNTIIYKHYEYKGKVSYDKEGGKGER